MTKEEMIQAIADILRKLYYEDVDFLHGMIAMLAGKRGC